MDQKLTAAESRVDLSSPEDIFDYVVGDHDAYKIVSGFMLATISGELVKPTHRWLLLNDEFMTCWDWHAAHISSSANIAVRKK